MKRGKNQAVYRYLPKMWFSEHDDNNRIVTAVIKSWNTVEMKNIYESFIESEIKHQIRLFGARDGDISQFNLNDKHAFSIVETRSNPNIPDIIGEISPLVFYCSSCGMAFELKFPSQVNNGTWKCQNCGSNSVKQLQMIYACECGHASAVQIPPPFYKKGSKAWKYRPNENQFRMLYYDGESEKPRELRKPCPDCQRILVPDNANSGRNYKPMSLKIINLIDHRSGQFYEKGIEAKKTIIAKWFNQVSQDDYEYALNNIELVFNEQNRSNAQIEEIKKQVEILVMSGVVQRADFDKTVGMLLKNSNVKSIETFAAKCDELFAKMMSDNIAAYNEWIDNYAFKLMQYYTLKYAPNIITLEDSINRQLSLDLIADKDEVLSLNEQMGIKDMQVSSDIQIINCTYGYTRRTADPKQSANSFARLKLNAFDRTKDTRANMVYSAKLDTEGILFEIDQVKIIEWLYRNRIISEAQLPDFDDPISVKKWFAENVHGEVISQFGGVDDAEIITKYVFALIHSIAHCFVKTAGEISGLGSNSLTEIIIVETASIFIYAQSSQGIPLGALSGMAESNYALFLKKVLNESKNCIFDPICAERDGSACSGCLIVPEISCNHFNAELGRKYLYTLSQNENPLIGFWEM